MTAVTRLFGSALFLGAMLLFLLEPMFGRLVLPTLGGAPAVWNTCLVFFQVTLLAGYLYAHASARWLTPSAQVWVHGALVLVALAVLPVRILPAWAPPTESTPVLWLLAVLATSIGLPFFVVSTTAPVLQQWFSRTDHPEAGDPYFLYQASNLGSMAGLVLYPGAVEPWLGLRMQGITWTAGYVVFGALVMACALAVRRAASVAAGRAPAPQTDQPAARGAHRRPGGGRQAPAATPAVPAAPVGWRRAATWIALAAIPSSLLLGVTTTLSTDVAVVPLLWVVPLLIYLGTFVLAFGRTPVIRLKTANILLPLLVLPVTIVVVVGTNEPVWFVVPLHLLTFAVAALVCHIRVAEDRPPADHLTLFYLCLSIGGAIGGLFNALVAPLLFSLPFEYPLGLVAVCLAKPYRDVPPAFARINRRDLLYPLALALGTLALILAARRMSSSLERVEWLIGLGLPAFVCFVFSSRPLRFGLGIAVLFLTNLARPSPFGAVSEVERSFFGVHRVYSDTAKNLRVLFHGGTMHGVQSLDPSRRREPLAYYTREGPIGQVIAGFRPDALRSVGVVGLGAGALAGYSREGQTWTFFEIDPVVVRLARDSGQFTYLADSPARVEVIVGDARTSMARLDRTYDLLVLDAFSSDAVPAHLLTREALQIYLSRLRPRGILAFHVSNRFLRLRQLFAALAPDAGLVHVRKTDLIREANADWTGRLPSEWVLLARSADDLRALSLDDGWAPTADPPVHVWTDDYSNLLALFRWR